MATWPSGEAEACKALHRGSIPLVASVDVTDIAGPPAPAGGSVVPAPLRIPRAVGVGMARAWGKLEG